MLHIFRKLSRERLIAALVIVIALLMAGILLLTPREAEGQDLTRRSALLILRGDDTLVFEKIERTARQIRAEIAGPGLPRIVLVHDLHADHLISKTTFEVYGPNAAAGAVAIQTGTVEFTGDSAILLIHAGGNTRTFRVATPPGTMPVVNNDFVVA